MVVGCLLLFILLCCIEGTVNELEVADCILELTFHIYFDFVLKSFRLNIQFFQLLYKLYRNIVDSEL